MQSRERSATRRSASSTTTRASSNLRLQGVRVLGTTEELPHILRDNRPDELLIAIPSASGDVRQKVVELRATPRCRSRRCRASTS